MILFGGCHCAAVRFSISARPPFDVTECNCSICAKSGYLHLIVQHGDFTLLRGEEALTGYRFNTGEAGHLFCKLCGIKSFYQPRSHPECWSVNFRCLDPGHGIEPEILAFDGQNWEASRGLPDLLKND
jgi:hypothetical protein